MGRHRDFLATGDFGFISSTVAEYAASCDLSRATIPIPRVSRVCWSSRLPLISPMSLSTLPPELIVLVAESLHPSAVLAFALTSRLCLQCSSDALRRQQQLATEYGVVSDLKPLTVPTLVRAVLSNPAVAFHIRSFESWGTRLGYHDWTAYDSRDSDADIDNADIIGPETLDVGTPPGKFWAQSELDYFKEYIINSLHAHWTNASDVVDSIAEGCDKPLKAVLFAHCPRLKDLSFVRFEEDDEYVAHIPSLCVSTLSYSA